MKKFHCKKGEQLWPVKKYPLENIANLCEPGGEGLFDHAREDGGGLGRAEVGQEGALHVLHRLHVHARDARGRHLVLGIELTFMYDGRLRGH